MADIESVLGRLTDGELEELRNSGPQGHLSRKLTDALDRAAGGPGAGRGYYVPAGSVSETGGPHLVLRSDVATWLFGASPEHFAHTRAGHAPSHGDSLDGGVSPYGDRTDRASLRPGDRVVIVRGTRTTGAGVVDAMTADAAIVWVRLEGASPRQMFHRDDPEEIRLAT